MNGMNDFDTSAGPHPVRQAHSLGNTPFRYGMNDFDTSASVHVASQAPFLINTTFPAELNDLDISAGLDVAPQEPPFLDTPFTVEMNNFNISAGSHVVPQTPLRALFADSRSNVEVSHEDFVNSNSLDQSISTFDNSAGQKNVPSAICDARFQLSDPSIMGYG